jgi:glutathionylspermidine synthase
VRTTIPTTEYQSYAFAWDRVARAGWRQWNLDTWAGGHRYLSLGAVVLTDEELAQLRHVTTAFSGLIDRAVDGILADPDWWSALAWPWPAIELARQEPPHPGGHASLYGRFDCLLASEGNWQVIEYNADTPSGGREVTGLDPAVARLHPGLRRLDARLAYRLVAEVQQRVRAHTAALAAQPHRRTRERPVRIIGVVSSHSWLEDIAQATWLAALLRRAGLDAIVGDVTDLAAARGHITLRGRRIDALYRFYPIERLYRHPIFASLCEASIDGRLLMLNGLRGFLAQSKACLAWLWSNRSALGGDACLAIERHLPPTLMARDSLAAGMLSQSVVKHVNGREGDSVVFGQTLDDAGWEARLLEGGYVVQRAVRSRPVEDVEVDDFERVVRCVSPRYACVGAFSIGGRFAGCYTRLDGPITSSRATFAVTLRERTSAWSRSSGTRAPRSTTTYVSSPPTY